MDEPGPLDEFKVRICSLPQPKEVTEKAMTKNFIKEPTKTFKPKRGNSHKRWTEIELKYTKVKGRLFDHVKINGENKAFPCDMDPLYSSFN